MKRLANLYKLKKCVTALAIIVLLLLMLNGMIYVFPNHHQKMVTRSLLFDKHPNCTHRFQILHHCVSCSLFQLNTDVVCKSTGKYEVVKCDSVDQPLTGSCRYARVEEVKKFAVFEFTMLLLALISNASVMWRRRHLDTVKSERLKRQIVEASA